MTLPAEKENSSLRHCEVFWPCDHAVIIHSEIQLEEGVHSVNQCQKSHFYHFDGWSPADHWNISKYLLWYIFVCLFLFLFLFLPYFTLQYCIGFDIHWPESTTGVHAIPTWTPLPPPTPYHLSGSSPCTRPKHPVSCIKYRLVIRFLHDSIHVSMPFSQIIPPSPSPSESQSLLYTSVSFLLSCIQGHHCHLSKFHIYVLVYCIDVFLSGLLHSV